ncbi:MAG: flavin reductase [Planctomycetes bacterium]|nr:flavin reductase [Planctomycetota bacterium]
MAEGRIFDATIPSPVAVVTTKTKDRVNGLTVAWLSQVSYNPPLIMVSIAKKNFSYQLINESGIFAVNVLTKEQVGIGKHFGSSSGRNTDKFKGIFYDTKKTGSPILKDVYSYLDCKVVSTHVAGDHVLFIGEVLDASAASNGIPLLFKSSDFI